MTIKYLNVYLDIKYQSYLLVNHEVLKLGNIYKTHM